MIDAVYRGANVFISFVGMEYADAIKLIHQHGGSSGLGKMGQVGRLDVGSTIADDLVLTA